MHRGIASVRGAQGLRRSDFHDHRKSPRPARRFARRPGRAAWTERQLFATRVRREDGRRRAQRRRRDSDRRRPAHPSRVWQRVRSICLPLSPASPTNRPSLSRKFSARCCAPCHSTTRTISFSKRTTPCYGLASGIWTADYKRAWRVARALEAGMVWINTYKQFSTAAPFGGFKDSGLGREKGLQGIRTYQQVKTMFWSMSDTFDGGFSIAK